MTESDQLRELETGDIIQLEGLQPGFFWVVQFALWTLWLVDGLRAIHSGDADWMDWSKVGAGVLAFGMCTVVLALRRVHGPPRIEFGEDGIVMKPRDLALPSFVPWADIDRIEMSTSQVSVHSNKVVRMPLSSYVVVRAVKSRLGQLATDKGIQVDGYW